MTDWQTVKLGDVAYEVSERVDNPSTSGYDRFVGLEHFVSGDFRITSWGTTENLISAMKLFKAGDTLFARRNAYLKRASMADFDGTCSGDAIVLRNNEKMIDGFLPLILNTDHFWNYAIANAAGSMSKRVRVEDLMKYEFPLPPVDEQRRIADLLWAADDTISRYSDLIIATKKLSKSRLSAFIKKYHQKKYIHKVKDLLSEEPKNGYSPNANESGKGYRTVSISAISEGKFVPDGNIKFAEVDFQQISTYTIKKDDVFVVRGNGNRYLAGKSGIASESFEDMFYPDLLIRLRFDSSKIKPAFANLQWNDPFVHREFISNAKSTNGIWKVNGQDIRKHTLIVPSIDEQEEFLAEYTKFDSVLKNSEDCFVNASKIKSQILNDNLTG